MRTGSIIKMNIVHIEGDYMNTIVTSKEEILKNSRELIREKGWAAVSIRSVASACRVSVGSIYNYYDSKAELISATVESVWCEIFHRPQDEAVFQDVQTCVKWMYERMAYGYEQYPGFFTLHSLRKKTVFQSPTPSNARTAITRWLIRKTANTLLSTNA